MLTPRRTFDGRDPGLRPNDPEAQDRRHVESSRVIAQTFSPMTTGFGSHGRRPAPRRAPGTHQRVAGKEPDRVHDSVFSPDWNIRQPRGGSLGELRVA